MAVFRKFWRRSGVFIANFEHILRLVLVFLLLTWSITPCFIVSIVNFEHSQKMKFSIKDLSSKYDQIRMILRIWSHLLNEILDKKFFSFFVRCIKHFSVDLIKSELEIM